MGNWLEPFLKYAKKSQEALADELDVSRATVNRLAQDHSKLKRPRAERMADLLGVSIEDLLLNHPPENSNREVTYDSRDPAARNPIDLDVAPTRDRENGNRGIPADGSVQINVTEGMGAGGVPVVHEGVPGQSGMTFASEVINDYWRLPPALLASMNARAQDIAVVPCQGDSMAPTLNEGDFVFVDTRHRRPSPAGLYAIADEFGGIVVKRLEILSSGSDDKTVKVFTDNPQHEAKEWPLEKLHIIGRVMRRFCTV